MDPDVNNVKCHIYYDEREQIFIHSLKSSTYSVSLDSSHQDWQVCLGCDHPSEEEGNKDDMFESHLTEAGVRKDLRTLFYV
jgi:hypothetical protein